MSSGRVCGVTGHPVGHSLSPAIHREAYRLLGLDWTYEAIDLTVDAFETFVTTRTPDWRGLSVTMPHKEATARLGRPDADVALTGVANTLVWHGDGSLTCHNTDIEGFVTAVRARGLSPRFITVLGAGATARSALVAAHRLGATGVEVKARRPEAAEGLAAWASEQFAWPDGAHATGWQAAQDARSDLVVSTVPADAGGALVGVLDLSRAALFDVSYHPWPTPLAQAADEVGATILDGLDLLVHQAVGQIRLFTGAQVDAAPLRLAAQDELRRRAGA